jgi:ankyrin repeat protein
MPKATVVFLIILASVTALSSQQETPVERIFQAIRNDDARALKELVADIGANGADKRGVTPLMYAAMYGRVEQLRLLIAAGADVNARNAFNGTALICATGDPVKSRILINHGADVNARSDAGRTPLMVAVRRRGNTDLVRLLLEKGADPQAVDASRESILLKAARKGDVEVMRLLISRGADVNLSSTSQGMTPLGNAVSSYQIDAVKLLLDRGARIDIPAMNDQGRVRNGHLALGNQTALMLAAPYGSSALVDLLLKAGADVNAKDERGMTALMLAVASETQNIDVVKRLVVAGADVTVHSDTGETALDWASKFANHNVIAALKQAGTRAGTIRAMPPAAQTQTPSDPRQALQQSVDLLQRSSSEFFQNSGCVACHHQPLTVMAVAAARRAGLPIDEAAHKDQLRTLIANAAGAEGRLLRGIDPIVDLGLSTSRGLREAGYQPDSNTDALTAEFSSWQQPDGSWRRGPALSRTPIEDSDITRTVEILRALQVFGFPARKQEFERQIGKAREWLLHAYPRTTDEEAMLLLGLSWTGAAQQRIRIAAETLISQQHEDGGWAGNPNLGSDAYATGEALYALRESGALSAADQRHRRGVQYLLRTQHADGSWYVASRAVKFQPYFQSGFPFEHDQWISAAGTAWAATAVAAEIALH